MIRGVIFDLDGTLIDSMSVWDKIDCDLLKRYHITPDEEYVQKIKTLTFGEGTRYIVDRYQLNKTPEEIGRELNELALLEYATSIPLKDGAKALLQVFKEKEYKIGMATSSLKGMCEAVLKRHKIYNYFDTIVYSEDIGKGKSNPDIYLKAAENLGILPEDCYVFEDVPFAAMGAKRAGMTVIGVFDAHSKKEQDRLREICHHYVESLSDFQIS